MPYNCCASARNVDLVMDSSSSHFGSFTLNEKQPASYAPDVQLEPYHIDIYLTFAHDACETHQFELRVVQHIVCNHDSSEIVFNGLHFHNLAVRDVDNEQVKWTYDGELISVNYLRELKQGEKRKLEFTYTVASPLSSIAWNYPRTDNALPGSALGCYAVTDHETERARFWLACIDYPVIRTTIDFYFTVKSDWSAYANGSLISEAPADNGSKRVIWKNKYPCPSYLICFAVGELMIAQDEPVITNDGTTLPVAYVAPRGTNEEDLRLTFSKTRSIIKFLENKIGVPFPHFEKYYQVIAPRVTSAMENISLVSWDNMFLVDQNYAKEWKLTTDIINLHECSHSYFGDALVIRHFEHAWLKESFAKFFEKTWMGHEYGNTEMQYELYIQMTNYMQEADNSYVRPIVTNKYDSSWDLFDRHLYPGGQWRLHMLMCMLGEDRFWQGVKDYVQQFSKKIVETVDFQRALERASGKNLTKFFEQWVYSCGYPKIDLQYSYDIKRKTVRFLAKQTQINDKQKIGYFDMDLKVKLKIGNEEREGVLKFANERDASFTFTEMSDEPDMILIDPNNELLFKVNESFNPGPKILLNTLREAPDVLNRIFAGKQYIKFHASVSPLNANDFISSLESEKFYGVRAQLAHALAANKTAQTCRILCWMIENEKEPLSLVQITRAAIGFRDEKLKQTLLKFLARSEEKLLPYISHGNALQALASQRATNQQEEVNFVDLILKHMDADKQSAYPVVKKHGYTALGSFTQSKYVYDKLLERLQSEKRQECRGQILNSLGSVAATLDDVVKKESVKILCEYTRDEDDEVKSNAIQGLVKLNDKSAISAIEASKRLYAPQYRPWVQHRINDLKQDKKDEEVSSLKKQLDTMQETIRNLQQQMIEIQQANNPSL